MLVLDHIDMYETHIHLVIRVSWPFYVSVLVFFSNIGRCKQICEAVLWKLFPQYPRKISFHMGDSIQTQKKFSLTLNSFFLPILNE